MAKTPGAGSPPPALLKSGLLFCVPRLSLIYDSAIQGAGGPAFMMNLGNFRPAFTQGQYQVFQIPAAKATSTSDPKV